jgi:hypothetical protein
MAALRGFRPLFNDCNAPYNITQHLVSFCPRRDVLYVLTAFKRLVRGFSGHLYLSAWPQTLPLSPFRDNQGPL